MRVTGPPCGRLRAMAQRLRRRDRTDWRDSTPWWPPEPDAAGRRAQRAADRARRRRLRAARLLRLRHLDARTSTRLAADGVRLANFHTTALCSPTRSCLLTGRNHHRNGMGRVADLAIGYPGYWGMIPRENGFLSEILRAHGYATLRGRQVAPHARRRDAHGRVACELAARPRLRPLVRVPRRRDPPVRARRCTTTTTRCSRRARYEDGYHLSADLADRAIEYLSDLRAVDDEQPFFCYFATGACHSPHHAPAEWIAQLPRPVRRGLGRVARRDVRPPARDGPRCPRAPRCRRARRGCRRGTTSQPEDQAVAARFMECFAAFLSYTDAQIGRVLDYLERDRRPRQHADHRCAPTTARAPKAARAARSTTPASGTAPRPAARELRARIDELGGPTAHNNYPWGWTMAGNTPFRRWKREVHEGGVADPCIVRLPASRRDEPDAGSDPPPVRARDRRAADGARARSASSRPTTIDGVAQSPIDGTSFALRARRRRRARAPRRRSTSRCSARARSTTRAGRR